MFEGETRTGALLRWAASGALALIIGVTTLALTWWLLRPLALVFLAVVVASALAPLVDWLARRFQRVPSVFIIYLSFLLVLLLLIAWVTPPLARQVEQLGNNFPNYVDRASTWAESQGWLENVAGLDESLSNISSTVVSVVTRLPGLVFGSFLDALFVVIVSGYLLVSAPKMHRFLLSLFPQDRHEAIDSFVADASRTMGGYVRGTVINAVLVGTVTFVGLSLIGVNFALALGVVNGMAQFVPIIGPVIAGMVLVFVAIVQGVVTGIITLVYILIQTQITENILVPQVMHRETRVPAVLVVIGVFAGAAVGGVVGVLVAVPLIALTQSIAEFVIIPVIRKQTGAA